MTRVFIDGAAGTTGLEIETRLASRTEFELIKLDGEKRKNADARRDAVNGADIVILCLPDDAARDAVALIDNKHTRVIDASTAHRTAKGWTYGFPEVENDVASAMRVSNPGCYATGFIGLIAPLIKARRIGPGAPIMCNAVSGYSGGGKVMIAAYKSGAAPAWQTYSLALAHKHVPEMQMRSGLTNAPLFAPAVVNTYRGMIVDVPLFGANPKAIRETLAEYYSDTTIINLCEIDGDTLSIERAAGTDRMDLFVFTNGSQTRLVAALDNLGKGASGAALQNLNLMAGLPELTGLLI